MIHKNNNLLIGGGVLLIIILLYIINSLYNKKEYFKTTIIPIVKNIKSSSTLNTITLIIELNTFCYIIATYNNNKTSKIPTTVIKDIKDIKDTKYIANILIDNLTYNTLYNITLNIYYGSDHTLNIQYNNLIKVNTLNCSTGLIINPNGTTCISCPKGTGINGVNCVPCEVNTDGKCTKICSIYEYYDNATNKCIDCNVTKKNNGWLNIENNPNSSDKYTYKYSTADRKSCICSNKPSDHQKQHDNLPDEIKKIFDKNFNDDCYVFNDNCIIQLGTITNKCPIQK